MDIQLTKEQKQLFDDALSSAFTRQELARFMYMELNVSLDDVSSSNGNYTNTRFQLLQWLERKGRIKEFTEYSYENNPTNPKLQEFAKSIGLLADIPPKERLTQVLKSLADEFAVDPTLSQTQQFEHLLKIFARELNLHPPTLHTPSFPIRALEEGLSGQRAVARIVLTRQSMGLVKGSAWATGFMVSPSLFLSCSHVIRSAPFAENNIKMQFNYQLGVDGVQMTTQSYFPIVDDAFHINKALDYTLIRLQPQIIEGASIKPGEHWGKIQLNPNVRFYRDQQFNIVHHPSGRHKEITSGDISELRTAAVRYKTDGTEPGSSGAPVFDVRGGLVAIHQARGQKDANGNLLNHQGIRTDRIVEDLRAHFGTEKGKIVLDELGI